MADDLDFSGLVGLVTQGMDDARAFAEQIVSNPGRVLGTAALLTIGLGLVPEVAQGIDLSQ